MRKETRTTGAIIVASKPVSMGNISITANEHYWCFRGFYISAFAAALILVVNCESEFFCFVSAKRTVSIQILTLNSGFIQIKYHDCTEQNP